MKAKDEKRPSIIQFCSGYLLAKVIAPFMYLSPGARYICQHSPRAVREAAIDVKRAQLEEAQKELEKEHERPHKENGRRLDEAELNPAHRHMYIREGEEKEHELAMSVWKLTDELANLQKAA